MNKRFQTVSRLIFLLMFSLILIADKFQLWMIVFIGSVLLANFWGRFYCGWICPINTVIGYLSEIKRRLGIKDLKIPEFLKKFWLRYIILIIFMGIFIFTIIGGKKLPVLPALLLMGIIITLFFSENLWHRYLCPYGSIIGMISSKSKRFLKIDSSKCINCGKCIALCPGDAVLNHEGYSIDKSSCLLCFDCVNKCPKKAIKY